MASMMDEMAKTLARRRAQAEKKEVSKQRFYSSLKQEMKHFFGSDVKRFRSYETQSLARDDL